VSFRLLLPHMTLIEAHPALIFPCTEPGTRNGGEYESGCASIQPLKWTWHGALGIWGCGWLGCRAAAVQLLLGEQACCDEVPRSAVRNAATHMRSGNMREAARQHRAIRSPAAPHIATPQQPIPQQLQHTAGCLPIYMIFPFIGGSMV
jgi:hypothetical protein